MANTDIVMLHRKLTNTIWLYYNTQAKKAKTNGTNAEKAKIINHAIADGFISMFDIYNEVSIMRSLKMRHTLDEFIKEYDSSVANMKKSAKKWYQQYLEEGI